MPPIFFSTANPAVAEAEAGGTVVPSCAASPWQPMEKKMRSITRPGAIAAAIAISLAATAAHADDDIVRWKNIVGVITAKNVSNTVANIDSGTFAWTVRNGHARVDMMNGHAAFE